MYIIQIILVFLSILAVSIYSAKSYTAELDNVEIFVLNDSLIANLNYTYKKYNRTSPRFLNVYFDVLAPWYENVTMAVKAYEWKDNRYKESIVNHEVNFCDSLKTDKFFVDIARVYSNMPTKCPSESYFLMKDLVLSQKFLPPILPIAKYLITFKYYITNTNIGILMFKIYLSTKAIIQKKKNPKNS